ncbi:MAG: hypothetical protein MR411_01910 [Tenericutes bacterium]|nr:hypothetical protein [Mycoplasmatota bacterium]
MNIKELIKDNIISKNNSDLTRIIQLREELKKYNMYDFLNNTSSLMLMPENQSKSVIFQLMISTALSIPENEFNSDNKISIGKFKYFIKSFYELDEKKMIDPPEFPFYLPVNYYGNYNIFMGANSLSPIHLNQLLKIYSIYNDKLEVEDKIYLKHLIKGMLTLSETIVKKINISFSDLKYYNKDIDVVCPSSKYLEKYKDAVMFDYEYIVKLFGDSIDDLLIKFGDICLDDIQNFDEQLFYKRPFIKKENKLLIIDVTTFLSILVKEIFNRFIKCEDIDIFKEYNKLIFFELKKKFSRITSYTLNNKEMNIELYDDGICNENLYLCGNDIVLYNIVLFDDGNDFNKYNNYYFSKKDSFISKRIDKVKKQLISKGFDEGKIVVIITPTSTGRNMYYKIDLSNEKNILILSPYEIDSIAINEADDPMFLYRYVVARNRLNDYHKNLFSELNMIALYVKKDYSFYINDEFDTKNIFLHIIGEYSSDYILDAYIKEGFHLSKYKNNYSFIEVIKMDDNIYFAPGLFFEKQLNNVIEFGNLNLWILSSKNLSKEKYHVIKMLIDMISYWLVQAEPIFKKIDGVININIDCDNNMNFNSDGKNYGDDKIIIRAEKNDINLYFEKNALLRFDDKDNKLEKEIIINIITNILKLYGENDELSYMDTIFDNKYKKKIVVTNSIKEPYMIPFDDSKILTVNASDINLILDDVGKYIINELKIDYGKISDYTILNKVVGFLYNDLYFRLQSFKKEDLIKYLYYEYEKNLSSLHIRQNNYANDLACYPNRKKEINNNFNNLNRTSVALKFLIELSSTFTDYGKKKISFYDVEYCLSIASQIIDFAYACDIFHFGMSENTLCLLKSNRIGYNHDFTNRISMILQNAKTSRMSPSGRIKRENILKNSEKISKDIPGFDEAFVDEFGYSFSDFTELIISMLEYAENKNPLLDDIFEIEKTDLEKIINGKIKKDIFEKMIDNLSLKERDNYLIPPKGCKKEDVYPWRNNRPLSFNRKPLIISGNKIIYGYRVLISSVYFLLDLINNGTLKCKSTQMKNYIAKVNNKKGEDFNDLVFNYLCQFDNIIVDKNLKKVNGKRILNSKKQDLGDLDIIIISEKKKTITIAEVKNYELSRNIYEMQNEYNDTFNFDNKDSFYNKHMRRVKWCEENLECFISQYNLKNIKWKIDYCFIVNNSLISNKALKLNVKVYTIDEIDRIIKK